MGVGRVRGGSKRRGGVAKLLKLKLIVTSECRGEWTKEDRARRVVRWYGEDGQLLLEDDPERRASGAMSGFELRLADYLRERFGGE